MRLKTIQMKSVVSAIAVVLFLFSTSITNAQEIIKDTVIVPVKKVPTNQRIKIDGIVATVGDYIVLDSDIDKAYLEASSQGNSIKGITRCQMMGKLLEDKLYAHQALQDSVKVTDSEVKGMMEERLNYMVSQIGSIEKVISYYKKDSEEDFKSYFFDILKEQKLASEMQKKIIEDVVITPEEVRNFFKGIPKEELPLFGAEMEVAQIVITPKVSDAEKQKVIDRLNGFKKEVEEGASFSTKAVLYSKDPGSSSNGGYYKMTKKTNFIKEFKDVAFSLEEGEISAPFETIYGFHIIYVEKIKGQEIELRHILLTPSVSDEAIAEAKEKITAIREKIIDKTITFAEAARAESDQKETRANGGVLINPQTQDTRFELTKMDPALYGQVSNLKDDAISQPILDTDENGKKSFKLVTVTNRINEHVADYATDYVKIKKLALEKKQLVEIGKWFDETINHTYIKILGEYRDCAFTNNWLKK
jgi:peptidyl-prolyl cis-trans isomerase SurA